MYSLHYPIRFEFSSPFSFCFPFFFSCFVRRGYRFKVNISLLRSIIYAHYTGRCLLFVVLLVPPPLLLLLLLLLSNLHVHKSCAAAAAAAAVTNE